MKNFRTAEEGDILVDEQNEDIAVIREINDNWWADVQISEYSIGEIREQHLDSWDHVELDTVVNETMDAAHERQDGEAFIEAVREEADNKALSLGADLDDLEWVAAHIVDACGYEPRRS